MDNLHRQYNRKTLPYRILHNNFHLSNIFVTGDGKLCSFDPHNKLGSIYLDIANLIIGLETCFTQIVTHGMIVPHSRLEKFKAAFARGYFQTEPMPSPILNLYRHILLIEKWNENEEKLTQARGARKLIYALSATSMRSYFLQLLDGQA
jgi:hypothetical protein